MSKDPIEERLREVIIGEIESKKIVVEDSANESSYLPALEGAGYVLRVREPDLEEHRMFRTPEKDVHIRVYSAGSKEIGHYLLLGRLAVVKVEAMNWLRDPNLYRCERYRAQARLPF